MKIDSDAIISVTEANRNFSRITRIAEKYGQAVVFKNNRPRYLLVDLDKIPYDVYLSSVANKHLDDPDSDA